MAGWRGFASLLSRKYYRRWQSQMEGLASDSDPPLIPGILLQIPAKRKQEVATFVRTGSVPKLVHMTHFTRAQVPPHARGGSGVGSQDPTI